MKYEQPQSDERNREDDDELLKTTETVGASDIKRLGRPTKLFMIGHLNLKAPK